MENTTVIVYRLGAGCDLSDVEEGKTYQAKVQGFATFGMFAQSAHKTGVKDKALSYNWQINPGHKDKYYTKGGLAKIHISSAGEVWNDAETTKLIEGSKPIYGVLAIDTTVRAIHDALRAGLAGGAPFGTTLSGAEPSFQTIKDSPATADVGDKLLVPFTWPEPTHKAILERLEPIPMGTALPGVVAGCDVSGDDDAGTV